MTIQDGDILYTPSDEVIDGSRITTFMNWLDENRGLHFDDYTALWQWSVDDIDGFWRSVWDYFGIESTVAPGDVLGRRDMPGAEWFPGTEVNYTSEFLRAADGRDDEVAIIGVSQTRADVSYTYAELIGLISRIRAGLIRLGVGQGDRVVAYMPNIPETVAALFATASLGAIWASAAPEFGPQAVIDRFGQLEPTVLLTVDGYKYGDKDIDISTRVASVRDALTSVQHTVALSYNGGSVADAIDWEVFIDAEDAHRDANADYAKVEVTPVPFAHPLYVLFSSGTTGLPKAIVHCHGGIILEHYKNHVFSWDLGQGDRLMWFTTTAWMMWNALVSVLITGASIVCLDGNPGWPDLDAQWRIAERVRPTVMGLGPAFVMGCVKAGTAPGDEFDLASLRLLAAAGSPLPTEGFAWLTEQFGPQAPVYVGTGGTDVCTGLLQGYPIVPVYAGEISAKCLGVAAYAFDEDGNSVVDELGELVITKPMPSMPVMFWGDTDMARYQATYFEHYPGVMRFGDWVRFTPINTSIIAGRSDATLNRGGVRIGTAEIYRVVEQLDGVADSLAVHLEDPDGGMGELVLLVHLSDTSREVDDELRATISSTLRSALSPRHVPNTIIGVAGIPRNLTGKKLELPIKKVLLGTPVDDVFSRESMANPEVLDDCIAAIEARS